MLVKKKNLNKQKTRSMDKSPYARELGQHGGGLHFTRTQHEWRISIKHATIDLVRC